MQFGFVLSVRGPLADRENIAALAREGEALGFDYVSVTDHVVVPRRIDSRYPYSPTGAFHGTGDSLETLTLLSYIASVTSAIRLITSVLVLPHRPPVLTAKMLATIDVLSGGRVTVGCGAGWMREEFEALQVPPFAERGRVTDETLRVLKELWTRDDPAFRGRYAAFDDVTFLPRPVQRPHPPLWIGGESGPALRRAATLGDGWYPVGNNPKHPMETPARYAAGRARLDRAAEAAGRDPASIARAYIAPWYDDAKPRHLDSGERIAFTGSPQQIAEDIVGFRDQGVGCIVLSFARRTREHSVERMARFMAEVVPLAT